MSFGEMLKKLRIEAGLTQQQLADKISLSKANVSKYESNSVEPNLETLRLISKVFNISANELLEITFDSDVYKRPATVHSVIEEDLIKKYRLLDQHGQKAVNSVLDVELERCSKTGNLDNLVEIPYVARSGERGTVTKTQGEIDEILKNLKPDTSGRF